MPDSGYEALSRLTQLRDELASIGSRPQSRWKVPPLFFFDNEREAQRRLNCPAEPDPFAAASTHIAEHLPMLCRSVEMRRVAKTIDGLRTAAERLTPHCQEARKLVELLTIPDDEAFLVLHPESRSGFRATVRGVADVGQFHILITAALATEPQTNLPAGAAIPDRFVAASRNSGPPIPAGIPMVMEARFQFYKPSAIKPDGTLPIGFTGCDHWLWPATPLAEVPRVDGERVLFLGPPAYRAKWDVSPRFQGMPAEVRVVENLGPFRVADQLSRLTGRPILPSERREAERELSKAA
jgi:hypothetical protein